MAGESILVVEDDAIAAEGLRTKLVGWGYQVAAVTSSGEAAVEAAARLVPQLVLMDIRLSGPMDGIEAAARIRDARTIPVVYLTAFSDRETLDRAKALGTHSYVTKPVRDRELQIAVEMTLARSDLQDQLVARTRWLDTVLGSIGDAVLAFDLWGRVTYLNRQAESIIGRNLEKVRGRPMEEALQLVEQETREPVPCPGREVLRTGLNTGADEDVLLKRPDGSLQAVETHASPLLNEAGTMQGGVLVLRDISERKEMAQQLANYQSHLEDLVEQRTTELTRATEEALGLAAAIEQAGEAVVITDTEGTIQYVNPAFEILTGYPRTEAVGQNPRLLKSHEHDEAFYREMWNTITAGRHWQGHFINRRKDGSRLIEKATIAPILDDQGRIVRFVAVKRDVTREEELEASLRQAQKMEAVGQLAGGVAHDFNNLLQAMGGYTMMALDGMAEDAPQRDHLGQVMKACGRATDLVRQLLLFSRNSEPKFELVDLNELADGLLKMVRRLLGEHIILEVQSGSRLHRVCADPGQLEQILMNLCVNARDAMPGGGRIIIQTLNIDRTGPDGRLEPHVGFRISDTGQGIPQDIQDRIFEPFFTTREVGRGTGLGLATVYAIVERHGGFVEFETAPDRGTTFTVGLPECREEVCPDHHADRSRPAEDFLGRGETVLVAEDDDQVRACTVAILESANYRVLEAADGTEALEVGRRHLGSLDLVLLDVVMPGLNGREVGEELGRLRPDLPLVYTSGYDFSLMDEAQLPDATSTVIRKPFSRSELLRHVHKARPAGARRG